MRKCSVLIVTSPPLIIYFRMEFKWPKSRHDFDGKFNLEQRSSKQLNINTLSNFTHFQGYESLNEMTKLSTFCVDYAVFRQCVSIYGNVRMCASMSAVSSETFNVCICYSRGDLFTQMKISEKIKTISRIWAGRSGCCVDTSNKIIAHTMCARSSPLFFVTLYSIHSSTQPYSLSLAFDSSL